MWNAGGTIKALGLRVRVLATKGNTNDVQWADWQVRSSRRTYS